MTGDSSTTSIRRSTPRQTAASRELEMSVSAEIGRIVSSTFELPEIYAQCADQVRRVLPFDRLALAIVHRDGATMSYEHVSGIDVPGRGPGDEFKYHGTLVEAVLETDKGVIVHVDDPTRVLKRYPQLGPFLDLGARSFLAVPLRSRNGIVGALVATSLRPRTYTRRHLDFTTRAAGQLSGAVANAHLFMAVDNERRASEVLAEVGRIVGSSLEVGDVYRSGAALMKKVVPFDRFAITIADRERDRLVLVYSEGAGYGSEADPGELPLSGSMTAEVMGSGRALLESVDIDDPSQVPPRLALTARGGFRSALAAPLRAGNLSFGAIHLRSYKRHAYGPDHVRWIERFTSQIAPAIENARLYQEIKAEAAERAAVADIARAVSSSLDPSLVYQTFARTVNGLIPFDRLTIARILNDDTDVELLHVTGVSIPGWLTGAIHPVSLSLLSRLDQERKAIILRRPDVVRFAAETRTFRSYMDFGLQSALSCPLIARGKVIGLASFFSKNPDAYTERHTSLASRLGYHLGSAVDNARLYDELRLEVAERKAVAEIGRIISASLDPAEIFEVLRAAIGPLIQFDRLTVGSVDVSTQEFVLEHVAGFEVPGWTPGTRQKLPAALLSEISSRRRSVILGRPAIDKMASDLPNIQAQTSAGVQSVLVCPLIVRDTVVGLANFVSLKENAYGERHASLATLTGHQLGPAFDNARLHREALAMAEERVERIRIEAERNELRQVNEAKNRMLSLVSHELRTPLTSIRAFAELLAENRERHLSDRELRYASLLLKSSVQLGLMIDDLLDLTRIERGGFRIQPRAINFQSVLESAISTFDPVISQREQMVETRLEGDLEHVVGDPNRLTQAISNLISNASKFSRPKSQIRVEAVGGESEIRLAVMDSGIGIAPHDVRRLFAAFFRADNDETRAVPGTGLGLYITKTIVDLHGGTIRVESEPGKGTSVSVTLPRKAPAGS